MAPIPQLTPTDPGLIQRPQTASCRVPDLLSFALHGLSPGFAVPLPLFWSGWFMAVEMLHVAALVLVQWDDPAVWIEALALLWYIY